MTRALAVFLAFMVVALAAEGLSRAWTHASRGELHRMQWGGER